MNKFLIIVSLLIIIFLTAFVSDKPYVTYKSERYYKCYINNENTTDTVFVPGGFMIIKQQTKSTYYDHFNCDEVD